MVVAKFCTKCGAELAESGVCTCVASDSVDDKTMADTIVDTEVPAPPVVESFTEDSNSISTESTSPPPASAGSKAAEKVKEQLDVYMKQASTVAGSSCSFLWRFIKAPVTTIQTGEIKMGEAIFFALVGFISLFVFVALGYFRLFTFYQDLSLQPASVGWQPASIAFSEWLALFLHMLLAYIIVVILFVVLSYLYGKLVCRAGVTLRGLFTRIVAIEMPAAVILLISAIIMPFFPIVAIVIAIIGAVMPLILFPFVLQAMNVSVNKAVYGTFIINGLMIALVLFYTYYYITSQFAF